jgi:hypothetical protein
LTEALLSDSAGAFEIFLPDWTPVLPLRRGDLCANTVLVMDSEPGDYIGGGDNYSRFGIAQSADL